MKPVISDVVYDDGVYCVWNGKDVFLSSDQDIDFRRCDVCGRCPADYVTEDEEYVISTYSNDTRCMCSWCVMTLSNRIISTARGAAPSRAGNWWSCWIEKAQDEQENLIRNEIADNPHDPVMHHVLADYIEQHGDGSQEVLVKFHRSFKGGSDAS
jgi:hypothetical protein